MKLYIAGPMRGYPKWNFPAFDAARDALREQGHVIVSPADLDRERGFSEDTVDLPPDFMRTAISWDIAEILKTDMDGIVLLDGWEKSSGCAVEVALGKVIGLKFFGMDVCGYLDEITPERRDETLERIKAERQKVYGNPLENHRGIAQMWAPLLQPFAEQIAKGEPIPVHVVALLMCALKLDRMRLRFSQDNYDDLRNYLSFAEEWQAAHCCDF